MLENARKRLRSLVKFIEKMKRARIYTDFQDLMGEETEVELPGVGATLDVERFMNKTEQYLKAHENEPVIVKLRFNEPLTNLDLDVLEKMLVEADTGTAEDIRMAKSDGGLGLFVRRIVGLEREAAKRALDGFLLGKTLNATQIQFVNKVIEYLTQSGWMDPAQLYESPFTDFSPKGVEGVFDTEQVTQIIAVLDGIKQRAAA